MELLLVPPLGYRARRLPLAPLLALAGVRTANDLANKVTGSTQGDNEHDAVRQLIHRSLRAGGLTPAAADRLACRLGYHPMEVWGDEWLEVAS